MLATLFIVWLYFNTFYVNAKRNYTGGPFGGVRAASNMKLPNIPPVPNAPGLPRMADAFRAPSPDNKAPAAPMGVPPAPPQAGEKANS